jgi:HK97 family phage major capsid protein
MSPRPRTRPRSAADPDAAIEAERRADDHIVEAGRAVRDAERARRPHKNPSSGEAWNDIGINANDRQARDFYLETGELYGDGSPFSYFRDLVRDQLASRTVVTSDGAAVTRGDPLPADERQGSLEDARARLATELRDVTSGDPGTAAFTPAHGPSYIGEEFATALRARGVMPSLIRVRPLPDEGKTVDVPRVQSGVSAGVQATEGVTAVSETDMDAELVSAAKVPISGQNDLSIQGYEFAGPEFDVALAAELGAAVAAALDSQIITGTGSSGQMRGLLNIVGLTSVAKTNATPTATTNYAAVGDLVNQTSVAYGGPLDTLLFHPRRRAFIESKLAFNPGWLGLTPAVVNSIPANLGGGTNEDRVIAIPGSEIILYAGQPRFQVRDEVLSGTLQVRIQSVLIAALVAGRKPAAIGVLSGTELATATF